MSRTILVYNASRFSDDVWLPAFWLQAKTYFEQTSKFSSDWTWAPCDADFLTANINETKSFIREQKPDVFAISLYVWNYVIAHKIATWVRSEFPDCIIISGGPHQYFQHDLNWFKKNTHLDASLAGEEYGEECIRELLDSISVTGKANWDDVSNIVYASTARNIKHSKKQLGRSNKKNFNYNWSAFDSQKTYIAQYINAARKFNPECKILSILETTRGCPYGCTYCDWGGGISTTVKKRELEFVYKDIDALTDFNLNYIYFADANFGIFGDRDVQIIKYLAYSKVKKNKHFTVGYGGFAKTANKINYIQQILSIDIKYRLSVLGEIKISLQSLDLDVLKNIDRKNIPLDLQLSKLSEIVKLKKIPVYVELIYGLPGLTLEKFYNELSILGDQNLSIQWYPWILLPEAPAYAYDYRTKYDIKVVPKTNGWWNIEEEQNNFHEIVIQAKGYSRNDYFEMLIASSLYKLIIQGGYLKNTINYIKPTSSLGCLIKDIITNFYIPQFSEEYHNAVQQWETQILKDKERPCFIVMSDNTSIFAAEYFIKEAFSKHHTFTIPLTKWLKDKFRVSDDIIETDLNNIIHEKNFGTKSKTHNYTKKHYQSLTNDFTKISLMFSQFLDSGYVVTAKKKNIFERIFNV